MKNTQKNTKILLLCVSIVFFMGALSLAAVPLYDLFCKVTGYKGAPRVVNLVTSDIGEREFLIRYDVNVSNDLNWEVEPEKKVDSITSGGNKYTYYNAKNLSSNKTNGIATYNIIPAEAAAYVLKVECFCFNGQELEPNEKIEMPLTYYIDPAIDRDKELKNVDTITISYTFFKNKDLL